MSSNVKHSEPRLSHLYINLKFRMLVNVPFQNWSLLIITKLHNTEKGSGEDAVYGLFLMRVFPDIHS